MHSSRVKNLLKQELTDETAVKAIERTEKVEQISEAKNIDELATQVARIADTVAEQSKTVSYQMLAMIQASNNSIAENADNRLKEVNLEATIHRDDRGKMKSISIKVSNSK